MQRIGNVVKTIGSAAIFNQQNKQWNVWKRGKPNKRLRFAWETGLY